MSFTTLLIVIVVLALIGGIISGVSSEKQKKEDAEKMNNRIKQKGFSFSKTIKGINSSYIFGVDESKACIVIAKKYMIKTIPFKDIMGVEVLKDGEVIHKKSMTRTVGGALIGGAVAGGVGSLVGGLSGSSKVKNKISKIVVKISVRDIENPNVNILCYDASTMSAQGKPQDISNPLCKMGVNHADSIKDTISVIIDMVEKNLIQTPEATQTNDITEQDEVEYLVQQGKDIEAVNICVKERGMSLIEATEYIKNFK